MKLFQLWKPMCVVFTLISFTPPVLSQSIENDTSTAKIKVGVAGSEPFVFHQTNSGIAVEIWEEIAENKSWSYEFIRYENVEDALAAIPTNQVDLVVGPISITSKRLETIRFSQPFYNSSISIISRIDNRGVWGRIKPLFSFKLLVAVGIFLVILGIVGTLFWLAERKQSPDQFSKDPLHGIGTGMWLAIVTMSTTGYGDKAPITFMGRIIAGTWMIISIIFATSMVAGIASTLTLSFLGSATITNIEQLSGRKAATISGSPSEVFLRKNNAKVITTSHLEEAFDKLENKEVDAIVFDRPQLLYFLKDHNIDDLYISKAEYYKQGYGFAFPMNSPYIFDINRTLLELAENQNIEEVIHSFIQKDE